MAPRAVAEWGYPPLMRAPLAVVLPLLVACGSPAAPVPPPAAPEPPAATAAPSMAASAPVETVTVPSASPPPSAAPAASAELPEIPPATVSVVGVIDGKPFAAKDAIAMIGAMNGATVSGATAGILLTDFSGACGLARKNADVAGTAIKVFVSTMTEGGAVKPIVPAAYRLHHAKKVGTDTVVDLETDDANGKAIGKASAKSGTVTFTAIDALHVAGSVDVKFEHGALKGTFDVPVCTGLR
jgi:hypothetical protein